MLIFLKKLFRDTFRGHKILHLGSSALLAILFMIVGALLASAGQSVPSVVLKLTPLYLVCALALALLMRYLIDRSDPTRINDDDLLKEVTLAFMVKLAHPTMICDDSGTIIWHNRSMASRSGSRHSFYGQNISKLAGMELSQLVEIASSEGTEIDAFEGRYRLRCYQMTAAEKKCTVIVWNDITELKQAYDRLEATETLVAFITIDNLDEIQQYTREDSRDAALRVEEILEDWAASYGGILREYDQDKYIFLFQYSCLGELKNNKFDVLDRIRDVRIGDGSLPVTVSIGIERMSGTLAEKERASRAALDLALQRGGDQVVLREDGETQFFGGRTKGVQKRTKVRARVVARELVSLMARASNVLIMGHRYGDYDSIGAGVGIYRLSKYVGVEAHIIVNRNDPNIRKAFEKLKPLEDYAECFIDGVSAQELIRADTLLIIVDVNNRTQFEAPDVADNVKDVVYIDHHRKTAEFRTEPVLSYIEPSASSTCELIAEILEQSAPGNLLLRDEAEIMLAGIMLDTKQFTRNTGVRTFSAALYLRNEGASTSASQAMFNSDLDDFMRAARFESNVTIYRDRIAIAVNDSPCTAADRVAAAKAADRLLSVDGIAASFAAYELDGTTYLSARSAGSINVQLIAERLGGGGHFDAAAAQLRETPLDEALVLIREAIDAALDSMKK